MKRCMDSAAAAVVCALLMLVLTGCGRGEPDKVFNGKNLEGWEFRGDPNNGHWSVGVASVMGQTPSVLSVSPGRGELINIGLHHNYSRDLYTSRQFGDCRVELEFMIPAGANSGVFLMGRYEIQISDSNSQLELSQYDSCGAIFGVAAPLVNAAGPAGQWQKLVLDFVAPRFDEQGNKLSNAKFLTVVLNDLVVQQDIEVAGPTGNVNDLWSWEEGPAGPLMLQGNRGSIAFRNIFVRALTAPLK